MVDKDQGNFENQLKKLSTHKQSTKIPSRLSSKNPSKPQGTKGPSLYQRIKNKIKNKKTTLNPEEQNLINDYSVSASVMHKNESIRTSFPFLPQHYRNSGVDKLFCILFLLFCVF